MTSINVVLRDGEHMDVAAEDGTSLMENLRDNGVDEIMALCSGCMSCATCQVYVEDRFFALLPPMTEDEDALLESSGVRKHNSRLSCQIEVNETHDGMTVTIAPDE